MTPTFASLTPDGQAALRTAVTVVLDALSETRPDAHGSWTGTDPVSLASTIAQIDPCPDEGLGLADAIGDLAPTVIANSIWTDAPTTAAHLHCPSLLSAAATELVIATLNQSLDSFDQSPAGTLVEDHLVRWTGQLLGLGTARSGVLTAGGTASNLLGLTLARARFAQRNGHDVSRHGLPPGADRWRILSSNHAHFSVQQAAALLGLGHRSVIAIASDLDGRMDLDDLDRQLAELTHQDLRPFALVGTAGTTDLGSIDPLDDLARRATAHGLWFHVDAAVGSGFALSDRLRPRLAGIELADSVTADYHKLWWQPLAASALLVGDAASFDLVRTNHPYLNRADDEALGVLNLVGRSLDTSRRFDALKVLVSLRAEGRLALGAMVDHVVDLATEVGRLVAATPNLALAAAPQSVTCVFRFVADDPNVDLDALNTDIQRRLFGSGRATVGRTLLDGRTWLKITCIDPNRTVADVVQLLDLVVAEGRELSAEVSP